MRSITEIIQSAPAKVSDKKELTKEQKKENAKSVFDSIEYMEAYDQDQEKNLLGGVGGCKGFYLMRILTDMAQTKDADEIVEIVGKRAKALAEAYESGVLPSVLKLYYSAKK